MWARLRIIYAEKSDQLVQIILDQFYKNESKRIHRILHFKNSFAGNDLKELKHKDFVVVAKILSSLKYNNVLPVSRTKQIMEQRDC